MKSNNDFPIDAGDGEETFWIVKSEKGLYWNSFFGWCAGKNRATKYSNHSMERKLWIFDTYQRTNQWIRYE